jgi:hypothetical protein
MRERKEIQKMLSAVNNKKIVIPVETGIQSEASDE